MPMSRFSHASTFLASLRFEFWTRRGQRYLRRNGRLRWWFRITHVPLAQPISSGALPQVHMDVVLVIAIRAGAEDCGEAPARALSRDFAKVSRNVWIGQSKVLPVDQPQRMDVERIGLAVSKRGVKQIRCSLSAGALSQAWET